jgi:hypothetical protein
MPVGSEFGDFLKMISKPGVGRCPNIWGLGNSVAKYQSLGAINPKYWATAGIQCESLLTDHLQETPKLSALWVRVLKLMTLTLGMVV